MQHEGVHPFTFNGIDTLGIARGSQCCHHNRLGLPPSKQGRPVGTRQNAGFNRDWAHRFEITAIDTRLFGQDTTANYVFLYCLDRGLHRIG